MRIKIPLNEMYLACYYTDYYEENFLKWAKSDLEVNLSDISASWEGDSYNKYNSKMSEFYGQLKDLSDSIESYRQFIGDYYCKHNGLDFKYEVLSGYIDLI